MCVLITQNVKNKPTRIQQGATKVLNLIEENWFTTRLLSYALVFMYLLFIFKLHKRQQYRTCAQNHGLNLWFCACHKPNHVHKSMVLCMNKPIKTQVESVKGGSIYDIIIITINIIFFFLLFFFFIFISSVQIFYLLKCRIVSSNLTFTSSSSQ